MAGIKEGDLVKCSYCRAVLKSGNFTKHLKGAWCMNRQAQFAKAQDTLRAGWVPLSHSKAINLHEKLLTQAGFELKFQEFQGGHLYATRRGDSKLLEMLLCYLDLKLKALDAAVEQFTTDGHNTLVASIQRMKEAGNWQEAESLVAMDKLK